jgi:hypothetical protein
MKHIFKEACQSEPFSVIRWRTKPRPKGLAENLQSPQRLEPVWGCL